MLSQKMSNSTLLPLQQKMPKTQQNLDKYVQKSAVTPCELRSGLADTNCKQDGTLYKQHSSTYTTHKHKYSNTGLTSWSSCLDLGQNTGRIPRRHVRPEVPPLVADGHANTAEGTKGPFQLPA